MDSVPCPQSPALLGFGKPGNGDMSGKGFQGLGLPQLVLKGPVGQRKGVWRLL